MVTQSMDIDDAASNSNTIPPSLPSIVTPDVQPQPIFTFDSNPNQSIEGFVEGRANKRILDGRLPLTAYDTWLTQETFMYIIEANGGALTIYN
jgi:hypothetical protein